MIRLIRILAFLILLIPVNALGFSGMMMGGGTPVTSATPTWGGEVDRWAETAAGATSTITLTGGVALGNTVVVFIEWNSGTQTLTSIADTQGNTYTIHQNLNFGTTQNIAVATAYATTALVATNTVTITWGSEAYTFRGATVAYVTGCASSGQPDQSANATTTGTAVSAAASTTETNTVGVGVIQSDDATYGSSSWTVSGAAHVISSNNHYYVYKNITASGSQDPGGTLSASKEWGCVWAALK